MKSNHSNRGYINIQDNEGNYKDNRGHGRGNRGGGHVMNIPPDKSNAARYRTQMCKIEKKGG